MSDIDSSAKRLVGLTWMLFAAANLFVMYVVDEEYTIPYHLIWASYALVYGLYSWSRTVSQLTFWLITVLTAFPLIEGATAGRIAWSECSEIVLMGVLVALLVWHVDRHRAIQRHLNQLHAAEQVRSRKRELAARFGSHEVRTRLTVARGYAELIRDAAISEATRSDARVVLAELDKASATATKLLTLVRIEGSIPRMPMHLGDLVDSVVRRWEAAAERTWSAHSEVGFILADPERMEAALDCLIENAVKFTATGDAIGVLAEVRGGDVVIEVSDTGAGMPTVDLDRVLEVFQTGSTAGDRAGSGLGLAIVKAIVDARGGALEVSSTVGRGSCFTMRLPAVGARPADARKVAAALREQHVFELPGATASPEPLPAPL